jgi:hypothetical protein
MTIINNHITKKREIKLRQSFGSFGIGGELLHLLSVALEYCLQLS